MDAIKLLKEIPQRNKDKVFLIDSLTGIEMTFYDLYRDACITGEYLESLGLKRGDRVLIMSNNSVHLVKLYFGCIYSGIVIVPVNPILSLSEVSYIVKSSRIKKVFISPEILINIDENLLSENNIDLILMNEDGNLLDSKHDLFDINKFKESNNFEPFEGVNSQDDILLIYTSGTTGEAKGILHSLQDLVGNGREFGELVGLNEKNRFYNLLPMTYLGGLYNLLILPYVNCSSVVIGKSFSAATIINFWKPIIKYNVNTLWFVPTIIAILMELDRSKDGERYCRENVKFILCGTAPLPEQLQVIFENRYGVNVHENYGLSETFFITSTSPTFPKRVKGVGKVFPGVKVRIVDYNLKKAPLGEEGEIMVNTPYLMKGYYNNETGVADCMGKNEWFATGDYGVLNNEGFLEITGRKKDLIIRGGINISPMEIENILYRHPSVLECAVIGLKHKIMGEEIATVMRLSSDSNFIDVKSDLTKICRESLSEIKQPSLYFELVEFPHTYTGKIQKNKIQAWIADKIEKNIDINRLYVRRKTSGEIDSRAYFRASQIATNSIEAISITYNNKVYEMKRKGIDVVVLSLGEAFFDIPLFRFDDLPFPDIYHYSHSRGIPELRENISKYFLSHYDVNFNPDKEIIITAGSKAAIHMAFMAILNPSDEVIIHEPAWVSYFEQVKLCYGIPIGVPYYEEVFDYEKYITNRTKAIVINSPNNPSGKVFNLEELSYLHSLADKYKLYILSDEAYSDFLLDDDEFISMANLDPEKRNIIICNSLSKNYGISGWRLGYVITNADLIYQILKINQHLITCPATILEYYITKHFDKIIEITKPQIKIVVKKRQEVGQYMDIIGLKYLPGAATFYFFVSIEGSKFNSVDFCTKVLEDEHISVVPGIGYGLSCDKFVRVSVGTESIERIKFGLDKLKDTITKTS